MNTRIIKIITGILLLCASIAMFSFNSLNPNEKSGQNFVAPPIFSSFQLGYADVHKIRITTPDGAFIIVRTQNGWNMPDKHGYIVSNSKIDEFFKQIKALRFERIEANDPALFDSYKVGEPKEFGEGSILEFFDIGDQLIIGRHIGVVGDVVYVRKLGDAQINSASGKLDSIINKTDWLLFDIFPKTFIGLPDFEFIDVAPITKAPIIFNKTYVFPNTDSLEIKAYKNLGKYWLVFSAKGNSPETEAFNNSTKNWAYAIKKEAFEALQ